MKTAEKSKYFESLAVAVASGSTIRAAAVIVTCSESLAYRMASDSAFRTRVAAIRGEITSQAVGRLVEASTVAIDTLLACCAADQPPASRVTAAKSILTLMASVSEHSELRDRIAALEASKL